MARRAPNLPVALTTSIGLRVPLFSDKTAPSVKIRELEGYLLLSAWTQGELAEERLRLLVDRVRPQDEWDHLEGWQEGQRTRTEAGVRDAKRRIRPDLFDEIEEIDWMVKRLSEEVDRLERDATKTSRAYAMLTTS